MTGIDRTISKVLYTLTDIYYMGGTKRSPREMKRMTTKYEMSEVDNWHAFQAEQLRIAKEKVDREIRKTEARRRKKTGFGGCGHEDYPCCGCRD